MHLDSRTTATGQLPKLGDATVEVPNDVRSEQIDLGRKTRPPPFVVDPVGMLIEISPLAAFAAKFS